MTDLDALLAGIVAHPHEAVRWLIVADWLDDHGFADRAELLRLHRMLIDTCCEPDLHPNRAAWQARVVELIDQGAKPCVPQHTLMLPGGVPLVGNFIPPGSFLMGGDEFCEDANPRHRVSLTNGFFLGMFPVTQAQWQAVMKTDPSAFKGYYRPVENVTWDDAQSFCINVSSEDGVVEAFLPSEAEWEYACRAGTTTTFHFGELDDGRRFNCCLSDSSWEAGPKGAGRRTTEVWAYPTNAWGLHDCHGNVLEWCADWFRADYYSTAVGLDPYCDEDAADEIGLVAVRGGSWGDGLLDCTSACRVGLVPNSGDSTLGFRVAFTLT